MNSETRTMRRVTMLVVLALVSVTIPAKAKSRAYRSNHSAVPSTQSVDEAWKDLDSNWGCDYSLDPGQFGQSLQSVDSGDGFDGYGYGSGVDYF